MANISRQTLGDSHLIVIKVGTSSLVDGNGCLSKDKFTKLSSEIACLIKEHGKKVVLVTSGAIAAGKEKLGLQTLKTIPEKQAAAAIGQSLLMREYENCFSSHNIITSQVLLTRDAIDDRQRYINSRNTIDQILKFGAVPIINENDTVSVDEIKVGDNDTLSALVASLMGASLLILLSDVEGFIKDGKVLPVIEEITKDILDSAGGSGSSHGTGGMLTKLSAAQISCNAGIPMIIAKGSELNILTKILSGEEIGTLFTPKISHLEGKKRWLLNGKISAGKVIVDEGASSALVEKGKSLLPVGIKEVKGTFFQGDVVSILNLSGKEIGKGITNYTSEEVSKIIGKKSQEAQQILGTLPSDEVINRDNMVVL